MSCPHIHFVTGRLAELALRAVLEELAPQVGFRYTIDVLPITVAALMTPKWVQRHLRVPQTATRVLLPGYCEGDLGVLQADLSVPVERGPRDLRQLPEFFGRASAPPKDYGPYDIEILAEINHAPRRTLADLLAEAERLGADGADLIDLGCDPGQTWAQVGQAVKALRDAGHRVSIDSFNPQEIQAAVQAGAELVLSVNSTNRRAALDWGCEVVVIPDEPATLAGLDETIDLLDGGGIPWRIDAVLEPIGLGLAASLGRYIELRRRYPEADMMMGIGNLTELTDVDSAGLNVLLLGLCQELRIRSVLTTQVINWAQTSVKECDLARRLVHVAVRHRVPPKHVEPSLITLRDEKLYPLGAGELARLARQIRDRNYRVFAEEGKIHLVAAGLHLAEADPFLLFERLLATKPTNIDPSHAFYLGVEMAKAATALTLGKQYRQDEALDWGYLTVHEPSRRARPRRSEQAEPDDERPAAEGG